MATATSRGACCQTSLVPRARGRHGQSRRAPVLPGPRICRSPWVVGPQAYPDAGSVRKFIHIYLRKQRMKVEPLWRHFPPANSVLKRLAAHASAPAASSLFGAQPGSQPFHGGAHAIHGRRGRNIQLAGDFVISHALGLQTHAFALQCWKAPHFLVHQPHSLPRQDLALRVRRGIAVRFVQLIFLRVGLPMALPVTLGIDRQISGYTKNPAAHVLHFEPVPQGVMQTKKCLLRDILRQGMPASQGAQIPKHRVAQFEEPSLDLLAQSARVGTWGRDWRGLLIAQSELGGRRGRKGSASRAPRRITYLRNLRRKMNGGLRVF